MYIKGYLQPTPGKNSLSANQVIWGVQMGNIKHNRHLHSRVTEEGKHFFSCKEMVMFSILITEKTKMHQLCLGISQCISLQMSFSTCTQYWYLCPRNSLFPQLSHREFWMPCGDDLGRTSEMGWRETGFLFYSGFLGGENCWMTATPLCSPFMGKGRAEGTLGEQNFAWHTNPSQMVMLQITLNSNVQLHRPSEEMDDLKQFMPRSKGIFKMCQNCHCEHIFDSLLSNDLEKGFPQWLFQM